MPRIRTLKPEFWSDEKLAPLTPLERLTFLGVVSIADDAGRLVDNVKSIDGQLFPCTNDTCREALIRLTELGRIIRYRSPSGQPLLQIRHWERHQKVEHPSKYTLPAPSETDLASADAIDLAGGDSRDSHEHRARASRGCTDEDANASRDSLAPTVDLGPTTMEPGPGTDESVALAGEREIASTTSAHVGEPSRPVGLSVVRGAPNARPARRRLTLTGRSGDEVVGELQQVMAEVQEDASARISVEDRRRALAAMTFAYWANKLVHPNALLDDRRERMLVKRLIENRDNLDELFFVIDGALGDDWIMGRDQRSSKRYDGIETLFRDRAQVERLATAGGFKPKAVHPVTERYLMLLTRHMEAANG